MKTHTILIITHNFIDFVKMIIAQQNEIREHPPYKVPENLFVKLMNGPIKHLQFHSISKTCR